MCIACTNNNTPRNVNLNLKTNHLLVNLAQNVLILICENAYFKKKVQNVLIGVTHC